MGCWAWLKTQPSGLAFSVKTPRATPSVFWLQKPVPRAGFSAKPSTPWLKPIMKHTRVVSTKCTPGFACRAFSDTTLVCFIVNEHTTKCSRYSITYACWDRQLAVFFVGGGENVPGIPGVCATRNFTYLVRGPLTSLTNEFEPGEQSSPWMYAVLDEGLNNTPHPQKITDFII